MKNIALSTMAVVFAAFTITSCNSDDIAEQTEKSNSKMQPMTFTATHEDDDVVSRTSISGTAINWTKGDAVAIWDGTQINSFTANKGGGTSTSLTGAVTSGSESFVAVYPYSAIDEDYADYVFSDLETYGIDMMTIPAEQTATKDSYDPSAAIMTATATSTDNNFAFKNVCAFLKITTDKEYDEIDVIATTGALAGLGAITKYGDDPVFSADYSPSTTVTLTAASGTIAVGTYYIAVAPGTITGLTIQCKNATGYCEKSTANTYTFKRSKCYNLGSTSTWTSHTFSPAFSVSDTKKVLFTKGNLYWNGSAFKFESSQTAYPTTWNTTHVGHLWWIHSDDYTSGTADYMPYASAYKYSGNLVPENKCWCGVDNPLTVDGTEVYYVLTSDEWEYLLGDNMTRKGKYKYGVTVGGVANCLVIAMDNFTGTIQSSYDSASDLDSDKLICLPPAGYRSTKDQTTITKCGTEGYYSTASTVGDYSGVNQVYFESGSWQMSQYNRSGGSVANAYRLVYTYTGE